MALTQRETITAQMETILGTLTTPSFTVVRRVGDVDVDTKEDPANLPLAVLNDDDTSLDDLFNRYEKSTIVVVVTLKWSTATSTTMNTAISELKEKIYTDGTLAGLTDTVRIRGDSKRRVSEHSYVRAQVVIELTYSEKVF